ncbi:transmembrane protein, putative (macronuclear) [Tetrahymena thermophila SB210]|uniref:Transmembrane protein, putative n=1 Tax=Tetrahymena thermophila (strain SB210) TaxID=312017 RepID=I7MKJ0_TETTS|nr:transmembrane protein, putative [Tetrahymena thermophila SB210]EAR99362.3 transmembrane protein, putative [Tetrahymena thermophila SB210]|eukprot:XP_001019607.3 transmembrane protein, putative [Tetrahymena thermophila SB210]
MICFLLLNVSSVMKNMKWKLKSLQNLCLQKLAKILSAFSQCLFFGQWFLCQETLLQLLSFYIFKLYSYENSQWGYILMAVAILILFEVALVLLVKHQTQEIFFGLYIKSWQILSIGQAADQIQDDNNNQQLNKDLDKSNQTGGQAFNNNISRNQHQIRILQSRSVLSNQNQDVYQQNGHKLPSRQSQSRNTNQQEIPKAQNYSIGVNNEMHYSNSYQQSLQKKSMTISQMKAHLGLDDDEDNKDEDEEEKKENRIEKEIFDKKVNENDEKILNFIKNNKDLYNHIIQSYVKMDNQFILKNNEVSKEIIVEVPLESYKNTQNSLNNGANPKQSADQFINLQNIQQEKILLYDNSYQYRDISNKISQNNNVNLRSQSAFQQQKQLNQNIFLSKSHHLIDIFQQEKISDQQLDNKNIIVDKNLFNSDRQQNEINSNTQIKL